MVFEWDSVINVKYSLVFIIIISRLSVYVILGRGWASNSKYALLGAYRGVAQTISYEVGFSFILLRILIFIRSYSFRQIIGFQQYFFLFFFLWNMFIVWLVTILAETNRTPFDFAEGESELVSGFNVEYGAGGFALLFMAEYGNIIFIRYFTSILFFGGSGIINELLAFILVFIL